MITGSTNASRVIVILCLAISIGILIVDLFIPLGVAGGVPYIAIILIAARLPHRKPTLFFATICTALTILGFFLSPPGGELWKIIFNRLLAIFAIWVTAIFSIQRKFAIDELSEIEKKLRLMMNTLPVLLATFDRKEEFQYCNMAWQQWFNHVGTQIKGKRLDQIVDKETYNVIHGYVDTVLQGEKVLFEFEIAAIEGENRHVQATLVPNVDALGMTIGFYLVLVDLTDHVHEEETLRQSAERYRILVENAPVCIHETDLNGKLIAVNKTGLQMMGADKQSDVCGRLFVDMLDPADRKRVKDKLEVVFCGEALQLEFNCTHEGNSLHIFTSFVPLKDDQGNVAKVLGVSLNITERKRIEDELNAQRAFQRQVIDLNPNFIFAKDREGRFTLANKALADSYGTTVENLIGATDEDFNRNMAEVERFRRDDLEVMNTLKDKFIPEEVITDFRGKRRWFQTLKRAIVDQDKNANQVLAVAADITEHKRAETALRESEERYRAVVENQTELVCRFLPDTTLTFVNEAYCRYFGKTREQLIGQQFLTLIPEDERGYIIRHLQFLERCPKTIEFEHQVVKPDGKIGWLQWIDYPITEPDGKVREIQSAGRDISDRKFTEEKLKKARDELEMRIQERTTALTEMNERLKSEIIEREKTEKSLRESYNLLNGVSEGTTDVVYVKDLESRYLLMNTAGAHILGKIKEKIIGNNDKALFSSEAADKIIERDRCILSSGNIETYEERITVAGITKTFFSTKGPLRDYRGNIIGLIGISRDITKRKQAEEALQASEERFRALYDNNPSMFFTLDKHGTILSVNQFGAHQLGYRVKELLGQSVFSIFYDEDKKEVREQFKSFVNSSTNIGHWEFRKVHKDGSLLWVKETARMVKGSDDDMTILVVCEDITYRKQAEMGLKKAHDELEQHVRERTTDLSNALAEVKHLKNRLQAENVYLQEEIKLSHNFEEIITNSNVLKKVLSQVEQVAATGATVLILGESGTGKELVARAIHNLSPYRERSLVKVDCTTLPANLIESELFGHEKGAFTGAVARKVGRFELAHGGTIFLDEIGDLPLDLQAKLLRVLQYGEFENVGGTSTIKVDVRIIAATNRNLEKAVSEEVFREDLYFRLNVFPIKIPPLRERIEDIPILASHFIRKFSLRLGKNIENISQEALKRLKAYHWPGNVRELESILERAVILTGGPTIELDDQFSFFSNSPKQVKNTQTIKDMERTLIRNALEKSNWVIQGRHGAAKRLDMPPSTLRERMKKYDISKP